MEYLFIGYQGSSVDKKTFDSHLQAVEAFKAWAFSCSSMDAKLFYVSDDSSGSGTLIASVVDGEFDSQELGELRWHEDSEMFLGDVDSTAINIGFGNIEDHIEWHFQLTFNEGVDGFVNEAKRIVDLLNNFCLKDYKLDKPFCCPMCASRKVQPTGTEGSVYECSMCKGEFSIDPGSKKALAGLMSRVLDEHDYDKEEEEE